MIYALTGTPGVGKTSVSKELREMDYDVLDLNRFIENNDLRGERDPERKSFDVDTDRLSEVFEEKKLNVDLVEGHLAHHLPVSSVIVLRCSPSKLEKRMENKDWEEKKIEENIQAEMLDTILLEALETNADVYEIDTTSKSSEEVADSVEEIISGEGEKYEPGTVDWSEELLERG